MKQVKIDGVLHNYEHGISLDPSCSYRIFTCPADRKFVRTSQHDFPRSVMELSGKFRTNGSDYDFTIS